MFITLHRLGHEAQISFAVFYGGMTHSFDSHDRNGLVKLVKTLILTGLSDVISTKMVVWRCNIFYYLLIRFFLCFCMWIGGEEVNRKKYKLSTSVRNVSIMVRYITSRDIPPYLLVRPFLTQFSEDSLWHIQYTD